MLRLAVAALASMVMIGCGSSSKPQAPKSDAAHEDKDDDDDGDDEGDREEDGGTGNLAGATSTETSTSTATGVTGNEPTGTDSGTGIATNVDQANAGTARLAVNGVRMDDSGEGYQLELTRVGGTAATLAAPSGGVASGLDAQCNANGETHFTVAVLGDGGRYAPGSEGCFVAVDDGSGAVLLGFEESCGASTWSQVDDTIFKLQCPGSKVVIDNVPLQSGVSMGDWLD
jgi:hypothetical protein